MSRRGIALLVAAASCFLPWIAAAQVTGEVKTPSGQLVEGASVALVSSADEGRKPLSVVTNERGAFLLAFDGREVDRAIQQGATWQVRCEKPGYKTATANLLLSSRSVPAPMKIVLFPAIERDQLTSKVDACADPSEASRSLYLFDFASDLPAREKLNTFQQLLGFKLRTGIRADLESAKLLADPRFEIHMCHEAPVRSEEDALFAARRLGCPGVISGFIEQENEQLKSMVRFTALVDPPLIDFAPVNFSSNLETLLRPDQKVNEAYLAFSAFVLGTLYLHDGQTSLAMQCFQHAKALHPSPLVAAKADEMLISLQQASPARKLAPIGATSP